MGQFFFGAFAIGPFREGLPSPKTNGWLEDEMSYWLIFRGYVSFTEGILMKLDSEDGP